MQTNLCHARRAHDFTQVCSLLDLSGNYKTHKPVRDVRTFTVADYGVPRGVQGRRRAAATERWALQATGADE